MKIETLERYIKKTAIPYGDLLKRAVKGGLKVCFLGNAVVKVADATNHVMTLYFEEHAPCDTCARRNDEGEVCDNGDTSCYPPKWSGWRPFECTMDEKCPCEDCRKERQWPMDR